jgi:hypothetical protein
MRILLSSLQSLKRHPIPFYAHWREYFVAGLREAGHEIIEVPNVDWAEGLTYPRGSALEAWRARTWEAVEAFVHREHAAKPIHLFLGYFYPGQVDVTAIQELQRKGIPCVNFFCDNVRDFREIPEEYRPFALHWVPEFEALPMYRKAGMPFVHAPMPCWIPPELRSLPRSEAEPPTFIGSSDILRRDLLARALQGGADFFVKGSGWLTTPIPRHQRPAGRSMASLVRNQFDFVGTHGLGSLLRKVKDRVHPLNSPPFPESRIAGTISDAEYIRFTREAMVTIGINRVPTVTRSLRQPLVYSRLRDIEAPMLGACYLTEWTEGLEQMYELGAEIETYRTAEELCSKLTELRFKPARRSAMRRNAQLRALADHSVGQSVARIGAHLGLSRT